MQGVGFRPFVYRRAHSLGLGGWVCNSASGVLVEVEGDPMALEAFLADLAADAPPQAALRPLEVISVDPRGEHRFVIRGSQSEGTKSTLVLPDLATCDDCLREIADPRDRRYRYPFTNCTRCGPRYSIIEALPYDRAHTTMRAFRMCPACRAEYEDPESRRFHAQPSACPACGPQLALWDACGRTDCTGDDALVRTTEAIRAGAIVAVKGLGGFHLLCEAGSEATVGRLRARKRRPEKPFALMFPGRRAIEACCEVSPLEAMLLESAAAPIVLLRRRQASAARVAESVAPGHPQLGVMLPYTPLHHLLLHRLAHPVVATSGNLADEPLVFDEREALSRLGAMADLFLVHDRPIAHPVDDSVVRVMAEGEVVIRRARGYAPSSLRLAAPTKRTVLALGGHLKNTMCLAAGEEAYLGPHIGDLGSAPAEAALERSAKGLSRLYDRTPEAIACDLHPGYASTDYAQGLGLPVVPVQHHVAHVIACLAEHGGSGPALGVAWDGSGYGEDETVWGGEFLRVADHGVRRIAHWRTFPLPGGEAAIREPRRAALGLLYELLGRQAFDLAHLAPVRAFTAPERRVLERMLERGVNAPRTSSVGRLFDAVAALAGLRQRSTYEGQAAAELEWLLPRAPGDDAYRVPIEAMGADDGIRWRLDWAPMVRALIEEVPEPQQIALRFHNALAESIVQLARLAGERTVALTGGCFQNRYLTERAVSRLRAEGFAPCWHRRVPPNDGGLSLGQAVWAARLEPSGGSPPCA